MLIIGKKNVDSSYKELSAIICSKVNHSGKHSKYS